ncbi:hypothetical protein K491DRAFT_666213 [Lophiostoma macrostomum CBS 122681]|uniref:Zn(2)-C6 fungal-type domain-containing protein n=1 Tax=Lophiostoma macrostomum CBS 122681 TaxID=1314788 RepID=A0A6A6STK5_9PLEO|nr:hypothetical protein K491DRAFT_666213 [Lophiostoma macrostomum CBS 122681]
MPRTPSSRGCDACRKQKKKCDETTPTCSRCSRLKIVCKGLGVRRWKFQAQSFTETAETGATAHSRALMRLHEAPRPRKSLSSDETSTGSQLIHLLNTSDLRYDITAYGMNWDAIPRRLGTNAALDAAVGAFVRSHSNAYTGEISPDSLVAHGQALRAISATLNDPRKAYTADVLYAVSLLFLSQDFVTRLEDPYVNHVEIMAHMLPSMIKQGWRQGSFEHGVIVIASAVVIYASIFRHHISIDESLGVLLSELTPLEPQKIDRDNPLRSLAMQSLLRLPFYSREPFQHVAEIRETYSETRDDIPEIQKRLQYLLEKGSTVSEASEQLAATKRYALFQIAYSQVLAVALLTNGILRAINGPKDDILLLYEEAVSLIQAVLELGQNMLYTRPFFASGISTPLLIAWALETDTTRLTKIESMLVQYRRDPVGDQWYDGALWLRGRMMQLRQRAGRELTKSGFKINTVEPMNGEQPLPKVGRCVIL